MVLGETLMTQAGYDKLQEELHQLVSVKRQQVAERIKIARDYGDISENAEYDDAKNEQARVEQRIQQLEERLRRASVVSEVDKTKVGVGSLVTVIDKPSGDREQYSIVGSSEADPLTNKVSNESPVGKALFGKKVGDIVEVAVPSGTLTFEIAEIDVHAQ